MPNTQIITQSKNLKIIFLSLALLVESFVLTTILFQFAKSQDFFSPPLTTIAKISLMLLLISYTYALTIGGWSKYIQFIFVPLPILLGILAVLIQIDVTYAILFFIVAYLLLAYDIIFATNLKKQLLKFNPRLVLRFSTKGILFIFAVTASLLVLLNPISPNELNIAGTIAEIADKQVQTILGSGQNDFGVTTYSLFSLDIKDTVETEIDKFIVPYKQFVVPLIALLIFGSIQFINSLIYLIFSLTVGFLYVAAKKVGFLKQEFIQVEQEVLKF